MIGHESSPGMRNVLASARDFELPHRIVDIDRMRRTYPQHAMRQGEIAFLDEGAGVLQPEFAVRAAATAAAPGPGRVGSCRRWPARIPAQGW